MTNQARRTDANVIDPSDIVAAGDAATRGEYDVNTAVEIRLTAEEGEALVQLVYDYEAEIEALVSRLARPDERGAVGLRINPETAEVIFLYTWANDPYGDIDPDGFPGEYTCLAPMYFAVDPDERIAVWFGDLPEETENALADKRAAVDREGLVQLLAGASGEMR